MSRRSDLNLSVAGPLLKKRSMLATGASKRCSCLAAKRCEIADGSTLAELNRQPYAVLTAVLARARRDARPGGESGCGRCFGWLPVPHPLPEADAVCDTITPALLLVQGQHDSACFLHSSLRLSKRMTRSLAEYADYAGLALGQPIRSGAVGGESKQDGPPPRRPHKVDRSQSSLRPVTASLGREGRTHQAMEPPVSLTAA